MASLNNFKELTVWQKSFRLCLLVYKVTRDFPKDELYGIVSQIRRSAVSVPSNIAEGFSRRRKLEYIQFLHVACGSTAELETQLLIAKELTYINDKDYTEVVDLLGEVTKMLNALIVRVKAW